MGEVRRALEQQGVCLSPSQIDYACRIGAVGPLAFDGAGNRIFAHRHLAALARYAAVPRRRGRVRRLPAMA